MTFDPALVKAFLFDSDRSKSAPFRIEAFNVFNRTNFVLPTVANLTVFTSPTDPNPAAEMITRTQTPGRQIQLALF